MFKFVSQSALSSRRKALVVSCGGRCRTFSSWSHKGHDLTYESLTFQTGNMHPKVILNEYAPSGFDVFNAIRKVDESHRGSGDLHMLGSVFCFPTGAFLWNVTTPMEVTIRSLSHVLLHRPKLQYLFIGCDHNVPFYRLQDIQKYYYNHGIVVEKLDLADAMGTFNILNAEDRDVAVALVRNTNEAEYEIEWLKEQEESISK